MNPLQASVLALASLTSGPTPQAGERPPAIEYSSLLDTISIQAESAAPGKGGRFRLNGPGIQAAFLPGPDQWRPGDLEASQGHQMIASLRREGTEVAKFWLYVQRIEGVFSRASVRSLTNDMQAQGFVSEYIFERAGSYELQVLVDGEPRAKVPFQVIFETSGDEFQPAITTRVEGPWADWGYFAWRPDRENAPVEFRTWLRREGDARNVDFTAEIYRGDKHVATAGMRRIGESVYRPEALRLSWAERTSGAYGLDILCQEDGDYRLEIQRDGKPYGTYPFTVKDGALVPHALSQPKAAGSLDYRLPRLWSQRKSDRRHTVWTERQRPRQTIVHPPLPREAGLA